MATIKNKSKMGSMMGVPNLNTIAEPQPTPTAPAEQPKQPAPKKVEPKEEPVTKTTNEETKKNQGGRPRFDIVEAEEMKMSFHCPMPLYRAIRSAAAKEMKTNKQLICEILFDALTTKYGESIKNEPSAE